jgi:exopolysaccharide biosynthesis polyprenyl glycosylphosphotransferase
MSLASTPASTVTGEAPLNIAASTGTGGRLMPLTPVALPAPVRGVNPDEIPTAPVLRFPQPAPVAEGTRRSSGFLRARWLLWTADGATTGTAIGVAWLLHRPQLLVVALLWLAVMTIRGTRDGRVAELIDLRRFASAHLCFVLLATLSALILSDLYGTRATLALTTAMAGFGLCARWCVARPALRRMFKLTVEETVLVVGDIESVTRTIAEWENLEGLALVGVCLSESNHRPRRVKGIPVLGTVSDVAEVSRRIGVDIVAVHDVDKLGGLQLAKLQWALEDVGAQLSIITPVTNTVETRATVRRAGRRLMVDVAHSRPAGAVALIKGAIDRVLAAVLLLAALPVIGLCVLAIKLTSTGPAIFRQVRVREHGRTFLMYKLRTMTVDAEARLEELLDRNEVGGALFKMKFDPRVTRAGVWLRRLSLDELPQLWNVVTGDMSLIGPRPALPHEVEEYDEMARRRLAVKPGLTGLWQVSGRSNLSWDESVRIDSDYVDNWHPVRDVLIALRTVKAVLTKDGAH